MKGRWNYRCAGNSVWDGTNKRRCLDVVSLRLLASLREAGGTGIYQNLWWAGGYNVIAFPVAAGVLYPFTLSPELAALSMSGSSAIVAIVAINALLLKRTRLASIRPAEHRSAPTADAARATGASA